MLLKNTHTHVPMDGSRSSTMPAYSLHPHHVVGHANNVSDSAWRRLVIPLFARFAYFPLFWAHVGAGETWAHERRFDLLAEHPHPGRVQPAHDPREDADGAGKFVVSRLFRDKSCSSNRWRARRARANARTFNPTR